MDGVELRTRVCGGHTVVTLRGQLDAVEAADVAAEVAAIAGRGQPVIVDLAVLEFIDCSALRALAQAQELARQAGGAVLLAAPGKATARLLDLTCMSGALGVHASVAAAVDSLADASARLAPGLA
jgi:anti-anti-sigma factor